MTDLADCLPFLFICGAICAGIGAALGLKFAPSLKTEWHEALDDAAEQRERADQAEADLAALRRRLVSFFLSEAEESE